MNNDYELLYLINEGNQIALELMLQKYDPLIKYLISRYKIPEFYFDDAFQESKLTLIKAVYKYSSEYQASFYTYFSKSVKNTCVSYAKKVYKYQKQDNILLQEQKTVYKKSCEEEPLIKVDFLKVIKFKKQIEKDIYKEVIRNGMKPREFADKYNLDIKYVYNQINKIKQLMKKYLLINKDKILSDRDL